MGYTNKIFSLTSPATPPFDVMLKNYNMHSIPVKKCKIRGSSWFCIIHEVKLYIQV